MPRRPDWRIGGRRPSPRAYERLVNRWVRELLAWSYEQARAAAREEGVSPGVDLTQATTEAMGRRLASRLQGQPPEPPGVRQIAGIGRPSVRAAVRAERGQLRRLGMPRGFLERRIGAAPERMLVRADELDDIGLRGAVQSGIDIVAGGPGERVLREWAEQGRDLIRSLAREATSDLPRLVVQAAAKGRRWESVVAEVEAMGARTAARARLIARDQVAQVNSRVTEDLQKQAGIDRYRWRTSGDGRVRDSHERAATTDIGHGLGIYTWAEGAPGVGFGGEAGHPGRAGQCRCTAEPVLPAGTREMWRAA